MSNKREVSGREVTVDWGRRHRIKYSGIGLLRVPHNKAESAWIIQAKPNSQGAYVAPTKTVISVVVFANKLRRQGGGHGCATQG